MAYGPAPREPFTALDGSTVVELVRPEDGSRRMSVAWARVDAGGHTWRHLHVVSDEVYYFLRGKAFVQVGVDVLEVDPGQTVFIPAGTDHSILAPEEPVELLCICAPPYSDDDTELLEALV
ncbi:MAG: cupin domain-containing protein [Armatimonadetes bacterium]|nr:cupin domain-containing protein [Armatimonadota bacterium]